jgi:hypothetical protein
MATSSLFLSPSGVLIMDDLLASLSSDLLRLVEDALTHDDRTADVDLEAYFVQCGLTEAQASRALSYRRPYLVNAFREGHTPIRKGDQALAFNPLTLNFEPLKR